MTRRATSAPKVPTLVYVVHVVAALIWGLVGAVAGERSSALSAALLGGSVLTLAALVLLRRGHPRARRTLLVADAVPLVLFLVVAVVLVVDAIRTAQLAALVYDSGAAVALYVPASLGPFLLAAGLPRASAPRTAPSGE